MKTSALTIGKARVNRMIMTGVIVLSILHFRVSYADVTFTQTAEADFIKGIVSNLAINASSIYLQTAASGVNGWINTSSMPQGLSGHRFATANNKYVYLVGGYNGSSFTANVYVATIQSGGLSGWTSLNPLPAVLCDAAVVAGTNTLYVIGGRNATQVLNTVYYANINPDGTIGAWQTSVVTLPSGLWGHTASCLNGYLYVAGGSDLLTPNSAINTVYYAQVRADNSLGSFSSGAGLPDERNRHAMVTYNGKIFVLGGYDSVGTKYSTVYYSAPDENGPLTSWDTATSMPVALSNHAAVITNGLIIVMAGATSNDLSNLVYYANVEQVFPLMWNTSPNQMYYYSKDGGAFPGNGQVLYAGGTNQNGSFIADCRFAYLSMTSGYVNNGTFVSCPFYELGAERLINSLSFTVDFTAPYSNCQVSYRTAGSDKIWSDWTALTSTSPINVNLTKMYLQYKVIFNGQNTYNATFQEMILSTPGTPLNGNLDGIPAFTASGSPYWVYSDIYFTTGSHTFGPGTVLLFSPGTGLAVYQASLTCNGTSTDSVKFMNLGVEAGKWDGIYFDPNSDNGVASQFYYTVIANAGYESNNANLYCNQTTEPLLSHCHIRGASGNGIRILSSNLSLQYTTVSGNTENGIYNENSLPTYSNCAISYNGLAGIYMNSTAYQGSFSGTVIDHNLYGFHYPSPNFNFSRPTGNPTLTANSFGLAMNGGDITDSDKTWASLPYDYLLLGTVRINKPSSNVRLTIKPGNTIRVASGCRITVVEYTWHGGELYAIGNADSMITFTSQNGLQGGWLGINFTDHSDIYGGHSKLDYCIIENGNDYNIYSSETVQPDTINHCIIRNAVLDGAVFYKTSQVTYNILNSEFYGNGRYPLYFQNQDMYPSLSGNSFPANGNNRIVMYGGNYTIDRTFTDQGIPYYFLYDVYVFKYQSNARLTLNPGVIFEFAQGKKLQIGQPNHGGELYAQGTAQFPIVFKAYNNNQGGWEGIYFQDHNDNFSGTSVMTYCTIKQGNSYNLYLEVSTQPTMDHCTISNSASHGIVEASASSPIHYCLFENNNGYPLKYNDWVCNSHLLGNTYSGNTMNYIALSGGDYYENRTFYYDGIPYHVLGYIRILVPGNHSRITIEPGVTLLFNPNTYLQIGVDGGYGGDLYAIGTANNKITFKPYNDQPGGWGGIYFHPHSDDYNSTSVMKNCIIEKGSAYNISCTATSQPVLDSCIIRNSATDGMIESSASPQIHNCQFLNNNGYPLKYNDWVCNSHLYGNTYAGNAINYIGLTAGEYSDNRTFYNDGIPYRVLNDIKIMTWGGRPRLTIMPGVILAFEPAKKLYVGWEGNWSGCYGGELWAEGNADSIITFKPYNDQVGGWGGIYFKDCNDNYYGLSSLKYCKIEKGQDYNMLCESSSQPPMEHCTFSNSASHGLIEASANPPIHHCQFLNNNGYPLKYNDWVCNSHLFGNTYSGNTLNYIALSGGEYSGNRTLYNDGIPYHVLSDLYVRLWNDHSRLTIKPGVTLAFNPNVKLYVGWEGNWSGCYSGDLYAEGNADSLITFKPYNDQVGGWGGIYFKDCNDNYSGTSSLKYCIIEKAAEYNILCESSTQPSMDHCIIRNSASHGMIEASANPPVHDCQFLNNNGYPLKYNDWVCNSHLTGNTYAGNAMNYIALSGGDYSDNRTFYNDGIPYHVLGDIKIMAWNTHSWITIKPGVTLAFNPAIRLYVGWEGNWSGCYGGDLYAEGNADSLITFKPFNGQAGGWGGIYFKDCNDNYAGTSSLKYCVIEKAAENNLLAENSGQPLLNHCQIVQSAGNGIRLSNSPIDINDCEINLNGQNGIYIENSSNPVLRRSTVSHNTQSGIRIESSGNPTIGNDTASTCSIFYNGSWEILNNTANNINARYNYWDSRDSSTIASFIFDKNDDLSKGLVYFMPVTTLPRIPQDSMLLGGNINYANAGNDPMIFDSVLILDFADSVIASVVTNASGNYQFPSVPSGSYRLKVDPSDTWAGVNSTDALLILQHTTQLLPLTGIKLKAGDINKSNYVNSTDALYVMRRFAGLITSFPSGDYYTENDTVIINGSQVTNNLDMILFGDVNVSFTPASKKSSSSIELVCSDTINIPSFSEFIMPVKVSSEKEISAISIGIYYPDEYLEITSAEFINSSQEFFYSAKDGLFRLAWSDLNPITLDNEGILFYLKIKSLDLAGLDRNLNFKLFELSELADPNARIINGVTLEMPSIASMMYENQPGDPAAYFDVCPNPFHDFTHLKFRILKEGRVRVSLLSPAGTLLKEIIEQNYPVGENEIWIDGSGLSQGLYFLKITVLNDDKESVLLVKLVVSE